MGREARIHSADEALKAQTVKRLLGEVKRNGIFDEDGCPKCGSNPPQTDATPPGSFAQKAFCPGFQRLYPDAPCKIEGEHLHGACLRCGFPWVEAVVYETLPSLEA